MGGNDWLLFVAALIPMVVGFIWYNPATFERIWLKAAGLSKEDINSGNMLKTFGLSYLVAILLAAGLNYWVHHDMAIGNTILKDPNIGVAADSVLAQETVKFIEVIKARYDHFGHGAVHGLFASIVFLLPVFVSNSLFERKGFKYIMVNWGYWTLTLVLMSGVLSQWY